VAVIRVGQPDFRHAFFPAGDQRVIKGLPHTGEAFGGVDAV
jgi:hypothetical protein